VKIRTLLKKTPEKTDVDTTTSNSLKPTVGEVSLNDSGIEDPESLTENHTDVRNRALILIIIVMDNLLHAV